MSKEYEAEIVIIGESGSGKSTLMNLIAGKPIHGNKYTCTYQDEDTHRTWKLHLFASCNDKSTRRDIMRHLNKRKRPGFSSRGISSRGIIYCHNINQLQLDVERADRPIDILKRLCHEDQAMDNVILCTTQWDILVDKTVGERTVNYLNHNFWNEALDLGARLARHDNTRRSVEEILGLIIKEAIIPLLLKELGRTEVEENYERKEQLLREIRIIRMKGAAGRAENNRKNVEYCWQRKLAGMSAELDRVITVLQKEVIEQRIKKEREDQKCKRNMWDAIQRAREERIEKGTPVLGDGVSSSGSIANIACASDDTIDDALVSGVKLLEGALPGDAIAKRQEYTGMGPKTTAHNPVTDSDDFVPLQFKPFTGEYSRYALSHELASKKIQNVRLLLDELNNIFDTNISISYPGIQKTLEYLINEGHDLGVVYAHLQVIWPKLGVPSKPYTGEYSRHAISHELASKKIQNVWLLLDELNNIFDTNISISYPGIQKTLKYLINEGHDLNVVYAHLQIIWPKLGVSSKPFTGDNYIIGSPELAFRKYEDVNELLSFLNMSFDTEISRSMLGVDHVLRFLVDGGYKFGDICAHMRYTWPRTPKLEWKWLKFWESEEMNLDVWENFLILDRRGKEHEDQRQKSLRDDAIHDVDHIKPRRIWDLYAHRIIPFQFSSVNANAKHSARSYLHFGPTRLRRYHPVSHSWTEDMSPVDSPVNAYEWPIPLPGGVTLEAVRNELLNLGAQYVWLDVVCLRQKSSDPKHEDLRMEEWKIDVPTIGKVYESSPSVDNVIRYLNGLGKAFRRSGWKDKRHWSQRAWTVQEVSDKYIEAGLPEGVKDLLAETDETGTQLRDHLKISEIRLDSREPRIQNAITVMKGRHSQNPMDKIFGLSTLLQCTVLPTYSKDEQPEEAWGRLLEHVSWKILVALLFTCPLPGENGCHWRPSWRQLMEDTVVFENLQDCFILRGQVVEDGRLECYITLIKGCRVVVDCPSMSTVVLRAEKEGKEYQWTMNKRHTQAIALGEYMLAGYFAMSSDSRWVLCKSHPSGELEKVSVLHCPNLQESVVQDLCDRCTLVEFC